MSTPITPETGKVPLQGASAITSESVPLLSGDEMADCIDAADQAYCERDGDKLTFIGRAIESAVRAKLGAGVPMTNEERPATGERIASQARVEEVGAALVRRARDIVVGHQKGSISLVQRHLRIGYNTAAKLLEALEQEGVVSPQRQNGQREVLVLPDISGIVGKEGAHPQPTSSPNDPQAT